jgi:hypothetical protein
MKQRFTDITKVDFQDVQLEGYVFSVSFAYLKHHLRDFVQVVFFDSQDAENYFAWPVGSFKHRYIDFNILVFKTF